MKAWQYSSTKGGLDANLHLNSAAPVPKAKPEQNLIQVLATALNPVDYKPAEVPFVHRFMISKPAIPGIDLVGRVVTPAKNSIFEKGQLVFGVSGATSFAGGALAEYNVAADKQLARVPDGMSLVDAATVGVAGVTAYQSLLSRVKPGDRVFINGGSGGTGTFGIQIAKALECHVTTSCSTTNIDLCKSLGADEVIDYRKENLVESLISKPKFDLVVDNVATDSSLYWRSHLYTKPGATYLMVAGHPSIEFAMNMTKMMLWPRFMGGGQRKLQVFVPVFSTKDLDQLAKWMTEGKVRAVIDQEFSFGEAPQAIAKIKTGRTKGKIVVDVATKTYLDT